MDDRGKAGNTVERGGSGSVGEIGGTGRTDEWKERFARQIRFPPIGERGQRLLGKSHVLIVGAGALGAGSAEWLARAGVGRLTVIDRDFVEPGNLHRQALYTEEDVRLRLPKAVALRNRLAAIHPGTAVEAVVRDASVDELLHLVPQADLVIDGTDNFETRLILNDAAVKCGVPWVHGACVGAYAVSFLIVPGETACLHCLLEELPEPGETCETAGIIAPAVLTAVALQTAEALKWLTGNREAASGKIRSFDLWENRWAEVDARRMRRPDCPSCGDRRTHPYLTRANLNRTDALCGRDTVQIRPPRPAKIDLGRLAVRLEAAGGAVTANPYLLHCEFWRKGPESGRKRWALVIFRDGRILVHGTNDPAKARSLVQRLLG